MSGTPAVSVVIPTYNQPGLLLETLASVFAQTFTDYEVIVVDDGSTDDTRERLRPLAEAHPDCLRVLTQTNAGTGAARNRGLDEARGTYVALLDHDDLWMPRKLEAQVEFLRRRPDCSCAIVPFATSRDPGRCLFDVEALVAPDGIVDRPIRRVAQKHALLLTTSVMMFPRATAAGLRFGTERGAIEDVPFQARLLGRGRFGVAAARPATPLAVYRIHQANLSAQASYYYRGIRLLRQLARRGEFAELSPVDRADLNAWLGFLGRGATVNQLRQGRRWRGIELYLREFFPQLRQGRLDFLAALPVFALSPLSLVRKWSTRGN